MATKKKPTAEAPTPKPAPESTPKAKQAVEVDWGKGFVEHNDAVVTGNSIKVPIPLRARHALGQSQTKGRYDRIKLKVNGQEARVGERRYHKGPSDGQPSLTFDVIE